MNFDALASPGFGSARFLLVEYLPTYAAGLAVLILVWAGAPGRLDFGQAWHTAGHLAIGELLLLALAMTLLAFLGHPLQLALLRILEGGWPLRRAADLSRRRQASRRARLAADEELPPGELTEAQIQAAGQAGTRLRRLFPPTAVLRPTALGNVLAATEISAGEPYGLDTVVTWPRLYPLLPADTRRIVDDRRDSMDAAARLAVTMTATTLVTAGLLSVSGWWLMLALIPLVVARVSYIGAVHAAVAYGESLRSAVDLHRFALSEALRMPLPADLAEERLLNTRLSELWRQGVPMPETAYEHPPEGTKRSG
ncbi:hypothetical protein ACFY7C_36230 [Streptomyces sp. NPDC012769]|uniref:hypothetical protein n=1 Tax=Streptomyces sp. NPDC012769 TaxID=3364848 RepID=UPI00369F739D